MKSNTVAFIVWAITLVGGANQAQERWAEKLFNNDVSKDFGVVAHGAELYHRFTITNIYAVPLDIADLRVSCGCVTATAPVKNLQPKESTTIDVRMDTTKFTGVKPVSIFVSIVGKGYSSSAELKVVANIRQDVVFNPGQVNFGTVKQGDSPAKTLDVDYAGDLAKTWQITDVDVNGAPLEATFKESVRNPDKRRVGYSVTLTLRKDAPFGNYKHQIFFKTTDPTSPVVPAFVLYSVQPPVAIFPSAIKLKTVAVGTEVNQTVVFNADKPLRILSVEGSDEIIRVASEVPTKQAGNNVQLKLLCKPTQEGDFRRVLRVKTDAQDAPIEIPIEGTAKK